MGRVYFHLQESAIDGRRSRSAHRVPFDTLAKRELEEGRVSKGGRFGCWEGLPGANWY